MKPGGQRRSGHDFEREIARMLRSAGLDCRRGLQTRDGAEAADLEGLPWRIECGHGHAVKPAAKLAQCEADAVDSDDKRPCVAICRRTGSRSITATMRLCSACTDCDEADDLDVVTMPVEAWIKRVVRDARAEGGPR